MIIFTSIRFKYESFEMFQLFLLPILLSTVSSQSIGHLLAVTFHQNTVIAVIITMILIILYSGVFTKDDDLFVLTKYLTMLNPSKETILRIVTYLYGFDRCPSGQTSAIVSYMGWTDNLYDRSLYLLIFQSVFFTLLAYISLKLKTFQLNFWENYRIIIIINNKIK